MSFEEQQEIIQQLRNADHLLRETQYELHVEADSEIIQLIANHMRGWEKTMQEGVERLEQRMRESGDNLFFQNTPEESAVQRIQKNLPPPDEPEALVNWSLQRHEELADWCASLAELSDSDSVREELRTFADELRGINRQLAADTRSLVQQQKRP